jgi:regulatory protein
MRSRLIEKSADSETVERVIARLLELGYLNDEEFAFNYGSNRLNAKALGRGRLRRMLIEKQVLPEAADRALERIFDEKSEESLCDQALEKHLRIHGRPKDQKQSRKLLAHLIRLGFSYDMAMKKIRRLISTDEDF